MEIANFYAAKNLVKAYRRLSDANNDELLKHWQHLLPEKQIHFDLALTYITGFGSIACPLCKSARGCHTCVYGFNPIRPRNYSYCTNNQYRESYMNIRNANSIEELKIAISKRADILENLINEIENQPVRCYEPHE